MILEDLSKIKVQAFKNLVKDGVYTADYAILEADKMNDKGKFQAEDYEELMTYLISLQKPEEIEVSDNDVGDTEETIGTEVIIDDSNTGTIKADNIEIDTLESPEENSTEVDRNKTENTEEG